MYSLVNTTAYSSVATPSLKSRTLPLSFRVIWGRGRGKKQKRGERGERGEEEGARIEERKQRETRGGLELKCKALREEGERKREGRRGREESEKR